MGKRRELQSERSGSSLQKRRIHRLRQEVVTLEDSNLECEKENRKLRKRLLVASIENLIDLMRLEQTLADPDAFRNIGEIQKKVETWFVPPDEICSVNTSLRNSTFSFKAARVKAETELSDVQDDMEIPLRDGHWTFVKKRHPVIKAPLEADTIPWDLLRPARKLDCTLQAAQKSLIEFKSSKLLEDEHHQDSAEANELLLISGTHRIHQTMKIKKRKSRRRIIERVMKYSRPSSQD